MNDTITWPKVDAELIDRLKLWVGRFQYKPGDSTLEDVAYQAGKEAVVKQLQIIFDNQSLRSESRRDKH